MPNEYFQPTEVRLALKKCGARDRCNAQITFLGNLPHHLVPVQTGKFLVNKKEGVDPKKDVGRLRYALGITENGLGFRKNGN